MHLQSPQENTLRSRISTLQAEGRPLAIGQALKIVVPLAAELAEQHRQGYQFFLYPSAIAEDANHEFHAGARSAERPTDPRDLAALPPEATGSQPGGATASVYGLAAILYELITLCPVGPGMKPPSELAPGVTPQLESILTTALKNDPAQRPDDLNALAQALYHCGPAGASIPSASGDSLFPLDVDVSMSRLPAAPTDAGAPVVITGVPAHAPLPPGLGGAQVPQPQQHQGELGDLLAAKARLESDGRARYVVVKAGMDHGPFSAVELLQQIASHTFEEDDIVVDSVANSQLAVKDSPDFSPFARHARMGRQEVAEKTAHEQAVVQESRSTRGKTVLGLLIVSAIIGGAVFTFMQSRGSRSDEIAVVEETSANVESDQGLKVTKGGKKRGGGKIRGSVGGFPQLGGGMSCEAAQSAYVQEMKMGEKGVADLTVGQLGAVLNGGSYLNGCNVPSSMSVSVCAAIQNGRAVGVSIRTKPKNRSVSSCISRKVRGLKFPSNPKLDVTRTTFAGQ